MREMGKGIRERQKGYPSSSTRDLPLDRQKTDVAHRKMVVKGKGKPHVRVRGLILIGHIN